MARRHADQTGPDNNLPVGEIQVQYPQPDGFHHPHACAVYLAGHRPGCAGDTPQNPVHLVRAEYGRDATWFGSAAVGIDPPQGPFEHACEKEDQRV